MKRILFLLTAMILLVACAQSGAPGTAEPTSNGRATPTAQSADDDPNLVRSQVQRITSPDVTQDEVAELVQGNNAFALDLYHTVIEGSAGNLIYSPYSISLAFSMVYAGARGQTEQQMAQVLHSLPQEAQHPAFNALDQRLSNLGDEAGGDMAGNPFQLNIANAVWGQQDMRFEEQYLDVLAGQYGAGLRAVDFEQNAGEVRQDINTWVADQTNERIQNLVPPGVIRTNTRLVLANAVYFNASWLFPFNESATEDGAFTLLDGSQVTVPLMQQQTARIPYTEGEGYQAVQLPYAGRTVDMLVVLPQQGNFEPVQEQLSLDFLNQVRDQMQTRDVTLTMPRFEFKSDLNLPQLLQELGMTDPFSSGADFSGMVEGGGLYISDALHQGTIAVDEVGTEATAATVIAMEEEAMERAEVTMDRPFTFAIMERETGTILFLGRVMNPAQ
jgi:serpin B